MEDRIYNLSINRMLIGVGKAVWVDCGGTSKLYITRKLYKWYLHVNETLQNCPQSIVASFFNHIRGAPKSNRNIVVGDASSYTYFLDKTQRPNIMTICIAIY